MLRFFREARAPALPDDITDAPVARPAEPAPDGSDTQLSGRIVAATAGSLADEDEVAVRPIEEVRAGR